MSYSITFEAQKDPTAYILQSEKVYKHLKKIHCTRLLFSRCLVENEIRALAPCVIVDAKFDQQTSVEAKSSEASCIRPRHAGKLGLNTEADQHVN